MNRKILLLSVIGLFMISCATHEVPNVSLQWEMGCNEPDGRSHTSRFILHNHGTRPLEANWVIYYNQLPITVTQDERTPVRITQIMGDFYKMEPTEFFEPIPPGGSLVIEYTGSWKMIRKSHAPAGAFIVATVNGVEQPAASIPLTLLPFHSYCNLNVPGGWPVAFGQLLFDENSLILHKNASQTDIFPTVKRLEMLGGEVSFSSVNIQAPAEFRNEADLLASNLARFNNVSVSETGLNITLTKLPANARPVNDEYYHLRVTADGIVISGNTAHAVFNGTQTLLALLRGYTAPVALPQLNIVDYPDLRYRGMMIDVSRNFVSKENILRLIDIFASYKLNRLHLHLTDDEGWRIEIPGLPELTDVGGRRGFNPGERRALQPSYGSGPCYLDPNSVGNGYFSREDFIEILRFAAERHIQVIPEIDFPGHARAAVLAMQARYFNYRDTDYERATEFLLTDFNDTSQFRSIQYYTDNVICIALPSTYRFMEKLISELVAMYTEAGLVMPTFHIGGDEVPHGAWAGSALARELMEREGIAETYQLRFYFFRRVAEILARHNLKMSGWQELATEYERIIPGMVGDIQYLFAWNTLAETRVEQIPYILANHGYQVVLSNVTNLYFDLAYMRHPNEAGLHWGGYVDEVASFDMLPFNVYRGVRRAMDGTPNDFMNAHRGRTQLTAEGRRNIQGIQGQLWHEVLRDFTQTSYALFPKMFGLVERAWNAEPEWSLTNNPETERTLRQADLSLYYAKIFQRELPWLVNRHGMTIRINPPGFQVVDGILYMNNVNPQAIMRFTTDGSKPTIHSTLWTAPVAVSPTAPIRARAFFLNHESVTILEHAID